MAYFGIPISGFGGPIGGFVVPPHTRAEMLFDPRTGQYSQFNQPIARPRVYQQRVFQPSIPVFGSPYAGNVCVGQVTICSRCGHQSYGIVNVCSCCGHRRAGY